VVLLSLSRSTPTVTAAFASIDTIECDSLEKKADELCQGNVRSFTQCAQLQNPDFRIGFELAQGIKLLSSYASFSNGLQTGDYVRFARCFWELRALDTNWRFFQTTVDQTSEFGGLHFVVFWEDGAGDLLVNPAAVIRGTAAWRKPGIAVSAMGALPVSLYSGELYDDNTVVLTPFDARNLLAVWAFCSSETYPREVRKVDQALKVRAPLLKVPFNLAHWEKVAAEKYPHGLPKPFSSDPTQWLFNGHPRNSDQPLHVAVARLLNYQWPRQTGSSFPDCPALGPDGLEKLADSDGIVCLSGVKRPLPSACACFCCRPWATWTSGV
jgi:hypothetical protein